MKRIYFLIVDLNLGGAQQQLVGHLRGLNRNEYFPKVISMYGKGYYSDRIERLNIDVNSLVGDRTMVLQAKLKNWVSGLWSSADGLEFSQRREGCSPHSKTRSLLIMLRDLLLFASALIRMIMLVRKDRPDLVHCFHHKANLLGAIAKRTLPCLNLVCTEVDLYLETIPPRKWRRTARRYFYRHIDDMALVCEYMREGIKGFLGKSTRIHTVHVIVQAPESRPSVSDTVLSFGLVGRLTESKGVAIYTEAARIILKTCHNVRFVLAGNTEPDFASEWMRDLEDNPHFVFLESDAPVFFEVIDQLDVFVNPSFSEGMNVSNLQAMAVGKPVIASDVGGTREAIRHQVNGLLVQPKCVQALIEAILWMARRPENIPTMGRKGREMVDHRFSAAKYTQMHEKIYASLLYN